MAVPAAPKLLLLLFFLFGTLSVGTSLSARLADDKSIRDMRKQPKARVKPQGPQQPVVQDEVSAREWTLSWVVKPPSDFLFLFSAITGQIT